MRARRRELMSKAAPRCLGLLEMDGAIADGRASRSSLRVLLAEVARSSDVWRVARE